MKIENCEIPTCYCWWRWRRCAGAAAAAAAASDCCCYHSSSNEDSSTISRCRPTSNNYHYPCIRPASGRTSATPCTGHCFLALGRPYPRGHEAGQCRSLPPPVSTTFHLFLSTINSVSGSRTCHHCRNSNSSSSVRSAPDRPRKRRLCRGHRSRCNRRHSFLPVARGQEGAALGHRRRRLGRRMHHVRDRHWCSEGGSPRRALGRVFR